MASPHYKLTYFDGRGRAEIIRLVLTAAGVSFEDVRVDGVSKIKSKCPFGQIPILEIDSKVTLCQSYTIARYLARKYGLAGKTDLEQTQADMIVDCIEDGFKNVYIFMFHEPDEAKKVEQKKKYLEELLPEFLTKLEALLVKNKAGDGYFVGDALTWADLQLVQVKGALELVLGLPTAFDKYPKLKGLYERVVKLPKIAAYQAKLTATPF